jgi:hypothetical protein
MAKWCVDGLSSLSIGQLYRALVLVFIALAVYVRVRVNRNLLWNPEVANHLHVLHQSVASTREIFLGTTMYI